MCEEEWAWSEVFKGVEIVTVSGMEIIVRL